MQLNTFKSILCCLVAEAWLIFGDEETGKLMIYGNNFLELLAKET